LVRTTFRSLLSDGSQNGRRPATLLARLDRAIDEIRRSGEFERMVDVALPILVQQTIDNDWFRVITILGTVAFALSGVVLAYAGGYTLIGAFVLAALPAAGGGVARDLLLQRQPLAVVGDPAILLAIIGTVLLGKAFFRFTALIGAQSVVKSLQFARYGDRVIELCDALGLGAFIVIGVVAALGASAYPLWMWGPVSAAITASFGRLMRDVVCRDQEIAKGRSEFYPEIAVIWGLALSLFLGWEAHRLQPEEIRLAVVVTMVCAFLTRMMALKFDLKAWSYA
jgi:polar amino acid transport system substrate-binding protein